MRMWSRASRRALLYCASAPAPVTTQGASLCGLLRPLGPFLAAAPFSCTQKTSMGQLRLQWRQVYNAREHVMGCLPTRPRQNGRLEPLQHQVDTETPCANSV